MVLASHDAERFGTLWPPAQYDPRLYGHGVQPQTDRERCGAPPATLAVPSRCPPSSSAPLSTEWHDQVINDMRCVQPQSGTGAMHIQHPRHSSVPKIVKAAGQGSNLRCRIRLALEDLRRFRGLFDRTFPNRATWQSGAVPPQFSPGPRLRFLVPIWRQSAPTVPVWPVMPSNKQFVFNY
jgi:hypothetical protein